MHYRERQIFSAGRIAAKEALPADINPHRPKTNFSRYWAAGHASVPLSKTPVRHTYSVGDQVQWREEYTREREEKEGLPTVLTVGKIVDVPSDQIEFNPHIHEDMNDTGVGHHQWLVFVGRNNLVSASLVELVL